MYPGTHAKPRADQAAFVMALSGEAVTYAELEERTNRLAHFLRSRGLKRLDHYAIFMENNARYLECCGADKRAVAVEALRQCPKVEVALVVNGPGDGSRILNFDDAMASMATTPIADES